MNKLLLIEGDEDLRDILRDVVTQLGFTPVAVATDAAARSMLTPRAFDFILLDCERRDGSLSTELLDELRGRTDRPAVVMLALSPEASRLAKQYRVPAVGPYDLHHDALSRWFSISARGAAA